jgi:hypothetical protein
LREDPNEQHISGLLGRTYLLRARGLVAYLIPLPYAIVLLV